MEQRAGNTSFYAMDAVDAIDLMDSESRILVQNGRTYIYISYSILSTSMQYPLYLHDLTLWPSTSIGQLVVYKSGPRQCNIQVRVVLVLV